MDLFKLKEDIRQVLLGGTSMLYGIGMLMICMIIYNLAGVVLATPYIWISGWDTHIWATTVPFAPVVAVAIFMVTAILTSFIRLAKNKWEWTLHVLVAASPVLWLSLPFFSHVLAALLAFHGRPSAAAMVYENRYLTLGLSLPLGLLAAFVGYQFWVIYKEWPRSTPPTDSGSDDTATEVLPPNEENDPSTVSSFSQAEIAGTP